MLHCIEHLLQRTSSARGIISIHQWKCIIFVVEGLLRNHRDNNDTSILHNLSIYNYSKEEIFGCDPTHPFKRLDKMGVLVFVCFSKMKYKINEVTKERIILHHNKNALHWYKKDYSLPHTTTLLEI